jgi:anti-sigma regulatory factor (Ser/Thr protein kinase)
MDLQLYLRVPSGPQAPATARRGLAGLRTYLTPETFENTKLLMTELTTNSVRHAGLGADDCFGVFVSCARDGVHVEVTDAGPPFDYSGGRRADLASGWGLYLVSQIADRWGIDHDEGNRVWFELDQDASDKQLVDM